VEMPRRRSREVASGAHCIVTPTVRTVPRPGFAAVQDDIPMGVSAALQLEAFQSAV
jgi:hypothetical protein